MRIGSLFSGAGGLDMAVEQVFGGHTVWHCELDPAASKVLAHRWPGVPNLADITAVDWAQVEPTDVLCGGFPCQDVSVAAVDRRKGMAVGTRSNLWVEFAVAIDALRPPLVVIENVRGLLSARAHRTVESASAAMGDEPDGPILRAAGAVLGDLASIGYDAQWATVAAGSVGAPHRRERVFIVAHPNDTGRREQWRPLPVQTQLTAPQCVGGNTGVGDLLPTPTAGDGAAGGISRSGDRKDELLLGGIVKTLLPTPSASDGIGGGPNNPENRIAGNHSLQLIDLGILPPEKWGKYTAAIDRWAELTRPSPSPTEPGQRGPRLNPAFSEWMMGWPAGWVTDVPGISRNDQLRIIGNGVVPQQAEAAIRWLLGVREAVA